MSKKKVKFRVTDHTTFAETLKPISTNHGLPCPWEVLGKKFPLEGGDFLRMNINVSRSFRNLASALALGLSTTGCFDVTPMSTIHTLTEWGRDINHVYMITTVITVVVFFFVAIPLVIALSKFREKPGDTHIPVQVHGNAKLELAWTIIPVILLIFIFVPTVEAIFKHSAIKAEDEKDALVVEVYGRQWWWEFHYPSLNLTTANEVHLPENTKIVFHITSKDVIHSFWVPRFGGKIDALPGEVNKLSWTTPAAVEKGGDYYQGQCVELCGLSHALMRFQAVVHSKEEFDRWTTSHNTPPQVASDRQKEGQKLFMERGCNACHTMYGTDFKGVMAPDLSNFGSRRTLGSGTLTNTPENLHKWLQNPETIKPGSLMPNLNLSETDIAALTSYIQNSTAKTY